jgi:hypothetical protein
MGLFKKKEESKKQIEFPELPKLPEIPKLPDLPEISNFEKFEEKLPQLPSFPQGDLGDKFSQNTIKEAVTGEKEDVVRANEMEEEFPMMPRPHIINNEENYPEKSKNESEPIFIRIDKFEEGSKTFDEIKKKVGEIEKILSGVKQIREEEEKEIQSWVEEITLIKDKLEKVNENLFSKVK